MNTSQDSWEVMSMKKTIITVSYMYIIITNVCQLDKSSASIIQSLSVYFQLGKKKKKHPQAVAYSTNGLRLW